MLLISHAFHTEIGDYFFMKINKFLASLFCLCLLVSNMSITSSAAMNNTTNENNYSEEALLRSQIPIESNAIEKWPDGPVCYAESAILIEASTGTILYEKNAHKKEYPASITKIMTGFLAVENASLNDTVTFSHNSVFGIPSGSSIVGGINEGDQYSMEFCLYGLMLLSGNETAIAIAEHVAGTADKFAEMMNAKAKSLGCKDTHFINPHGLHNEKHYTSAYDMALITKAAIQNPDFKKFICTATYDFPPTKTGEIRYDKRNHHKMMEGGAYEYEGCIGGKTGYTTDAGSTLVSIAERNGMTLICVVMKEDKPSHWTDTATLFDYGFQNFQKMNISENEKNFSIDNANFFKTESNIFGNTKPIIQVNKNGCIIIPKNSVFTDAVPSLNFEKANESQNIVASLDYTFSNHYVGYTTLDLVTSDNTFAFSTNSSSIEDGKKASISKKDGSVTLVKSTPITNVIVFILIGIIMVCLLVIVVTLILQKYRIFKNAKYVGTRRKVPNKSRRRPKRKKYPSKYDKYNF